MLSYFKKNILGTIKQVGSILESSIEMEVLISTKNQFLGSKYSNAYSHIRISTGLALMKGLEVSSCMHIVAP